jgi:NhaP-type Na+/H+ or K+/H+ antiporter
MTTFTFILVLMLAVALSAIIDQFVHGVSMPLIQIVIGIVLAVAGATTSGFTVNSELFLVLFIAPLLYREACDVDKAALWNNRKPILSLAIGLVIVVVLIVGFMLHWIEPSIPLAAAFALGAALGPTDAVAVSSLSQRASLPKRQSILLSGESLINDASGVVSFQFAAAALVTGAFSLLDATVSFLVAFFGGILIGLVLEAAISFLINKVKDAGLDDTTFHVLSDVLTPFVIFLIGEGIGASGILAVVAAGLSSSLYKHSIGPNEARLEIVSSSVWQVLSFCLNGIVFVLLGMQLPGAVTQSWEDISLNNFELIGLVLVISAIIIAVRAVWFLMIFFARNRRTALESEGLVKPSRWQRRQRNRQFGRAGKPDPRRTAKTMETIDTTEPEAGMTGVLSPAPADNDVRAEALAAVPTIALDEKRPAASTVASAADTAGTADAVKGEGESAAAGGEDEAVSDEEAAAEALSSLEEEGDDIVAASSAASETGAAEAYGAASGKAGDAAGASASGAGESAAAEGFASGKSKAGWKRVDQGDGEPACIYRRKPNGKVRVKVCTKETLLDSLAMSLAGPKGAISLSIMFTLPYMTVDNMVFMQRDMLIFIASGVILITLLLANFLLPVLKPRTDDQQQEDSVSALIQILRHVVADLGAQETRENHRATQAVIRQYNERINRCKQSISDDDVDEGERKLRLKVYRWIDEYIVEQVDKGEASAAVAYPILHRIRRAESILTGRQGINTLPARIAQTVGEFFRRVKHFIQDRSFFEDSFDRARSSRELQINAYTHGVLRLRRALADDELDVDVEDATTVMLDFQRALRRMRRIEREDASVTVVAHTADKAEQLRSFALNRERTYIHEAQEKGLISRATANHLRENVNMMEVALDEDV